MKRLAACLLVLVLALSCIPAMAEGYGFSPEMFAAGFDQILAGQNLSAEWHALESNEGVITFEAVITPMTQPHSIVMYVKDGEVLRFDARYALPTADGVTIDQTAGAEASLQQTILATTVWLLQHMEDSDFQAQYQARTEAMNAELGLMMDLFAMMTDEGAQNATKGSTLFGQPIRSTLTLDRENCVMTLETVMLPSAELFE